MAAEIEPSRIWEALKKAFEKKPSDLKNKRLEKAPNKQASPEQLKQIKDQRERSALAKTFSHVDNLTVEGANIVDRLVNHNDPKETHGLPATGEALIRDVKQAVNSTAISPEEGIKILFQAGGLYGHFDKEGYNHAKDYTDAIASIAVEQKMSENRVYQALGEAAEQYAVSSFNDDLESEGVFQGPFALMEKQISNGEYPKDLGVSSPPEESWLGQVKYQKMMELHGVSQENIVIPEEEFLGDGQVFAAQAEPTIPKSVPTEPSQARGEPEIRGEAYVSTDATGGASGGQGGGGKDNAPPDVPTEPEPEPTGRFDWLYNEKRQGEPAVNNGFRALLRNCVQEFELHPEYADQPEKIRIMIEQIGVFNAPASEKIEYIEKLIQKHNDLIVQKINEISNEANSAGHAKTISNIKDNINNRPDILRNEDAIRGQITLLEKQTGQAKTKEELRQLLNNQLEYRFRFEIVQRLNLPDEDVQANYQHFEKIKTDILNHGYVEPYKDRFYTYAEQKRREAILFSRQLGLKERYNAFALSDPEFKRLMENPDLAVEKYLRQVEATTLFGEELSSQEAQSRLRLMIGQLNNIQTLMTGGEKVDEIEKYIQENSGEGKLFPNEVSSEVFRKGWTRVATELSHKINKRQEALRANALIMGVGDFKAVEQAMMTFGDEGLQMLLGENGGLVSDAVDIYLATLSEDLYDESGKPRRYTRDWQESIRLRATERMQDRISIYSEKYKKAFFKHGIGGGEVNLGKEDIKAIMRLADYYSTLSGRKLIALENQLPLSEWGKTSTFDSSGIWERLLSARKINAFFFDRWNFLTDPQQIMWDEAAVFAVQASGRDRQAIARLNETKRGSPEWMDLCKEVFGTDAKGEVNKATIAKFLNLEQRRRILWIRVEQAIPFADHTISEENALKYLNKNLMKRALLVHEGKKETDRVLMTYDQFSSGWRLQKYLNQAEAIWSWGDKMGLGLRLRKEGMHLLDAGTPKTRKEAIEGKKITTKNESGEDVEVKFHSKDARTGVKGILDTIAAYRPQALFKFLFDGKDKNTQEWFDKQVRDGNFDVLGMKKPENDQTPVLFRGDLLYKFLNQKFITINQALLRNGLSPIDFISGPNDEQMKIVKQICASSDDALKADPKKYLQMMKSLAEHIFDEKQITELTTPKYRDIYYAAQWIDDFGNEYLEHPQDAPGRKNSVITIKPISEELLAGAKEEDRRLGVSVYMGSVGKDSAIVRTWRDYGAAVESAPKVANALNLDDKHWIETVYELFQVVKSYSGEKPAAVKTALLLSAGRLKALKADTLYNLISAAEPLARSSEMRRILNYGVQVITPNEMIEDAFKLANQLMSNIQDVAPEWNTVFEEFIGVRLGVNIETSGIPIFNHILPDKVSIHIPGRVPIYLERGKLIFLVIILALLAESAIAITSGLKEEKS